MPTGESIRLDDGSEGFVFRPEGAAPKGVVVILHERYGLAQHTLDLAAKLRDDGFLALAPNLFSHWQGDLEAVAQGAARARISDEDCAKMLDSWIEHLPRFADVPQGKLALMGVCQSGRYPIVVASRRRDVSACVIYYGAASAADWKITATQPSGIDEMIATMEAPAFLVFAEKDHVISIDDVLRVRQSLERHRKSYRMEIVPDAPHGFLDSTKPGRFRESEAAQSWASLLTFLEDVFEGGWPGESIVWQFSAESAPSYDFEKNVRLE